MTEHVTQDWFRGSGSAASAPINRVRIRVKGHRGAAAPGGVQEPQVHLRAGDRRRPRAHARPGQLGRSGQPAAGSASGSNKDAAKAVGELIAKQAKEKGIKKVVFDRGGYLYHGNIKALADAAREKGLEF